MELLVFGHAGLPVMVFPTSGGRFFEYEDRGMIAALSGKIDAGHVIRAGGSRRGTLRVFMDVKCPVILTAQNRF